MQHYLTQLRNIYDGEPWYGESLMDKLEALTPEQAFTSLTPKMHSIAQIVAHMLVWRRVLAEHLKDNTDFRPEVDSAEDWNPSTKLKAKGWEKLLAELEANQAELCRLLETQSGKWLEKPFRDGHTYRFLVEGVIQHDVYHIGQIGLLMALESQKRQ